MNAKKYELLDEPGTGLKRLRALRSFSSVTAGDLGGLIEREENLGHEGCCWVSDNSQVFGDEQPDDEPKRASE